MQYDNNQLTFNKNKLNPTKLPKEILENIDLILNNLNSAIALNYIEINVTNNASIELIYSNKTTINNDIIFLIMKLGH